MSNYIDERKKLILSELNNYGKVSVAQLAKKFNVTSETIRRDLDTLESEFKLKRIHGGAIKYSFDRQEPSHTNRGQIYRNEKQTIGKKAATLVNDNDVIAIDAGTTTCEILNHLRNKVNITVLLNNIAALNVLIELKNNGLFDGKIIFLGGEIDTLQLSTFGPVSEKIMEDFYVDKAFISIGGINLQNGFTSYNINEANLSKRIMESAKESIIVADSSKIGVTNFYKLADIDGVNAVVCDKDAPDEWRDILKERGVIWIVS